jgi:hypothetical protein
MIFLVFPHCLVQQELTLTPTQTGCCRCGPINTLYNIVKSRTNVISRCNWAYKKANTVIVLENGCEEKCNQKLQFEGQIKTKQWPTEKRQKDKQLSRKTLHRKLKI